MPITHAELRAGATRGARLPSWVPGAADSDQSGCDVKCGTSMSTQLDELCAGLHAMGRLWRRSGADHKRSGTAKSCTASCFMESAPPDATAAH